MKNHSIDLIEKLDRPKRVTLLEKHFGLFHSRLSMTVQVVASDSNATRKEPTNMVNLKPLIEASVSNWNNQLKTKSP